MEVPKSALTGMAILASSASIAVTSEIANGHVSVEDNAPVTESESTQKYNEEMTEYCGALAIAGSYKFSFPRSFGATKTTHKAELPAQDPECVYYGGARSKVIYDTVARSGKKVNKVSSGHIRVTGGDKESFTEKLSIRDCKKGEKTRKLAGRSRYFIKDDENKVRVKTFYTKASTQRC